ncbi:ATP-binding protein [Xanthomonas theicola]|uniref:Sensory/regulatory protein RpfC n=1 Tax=Xanthomonas theicola TaxID=56464 RepID=A0A2S6ZIX2_9XANT|nr:ATP-binding protein [Xanthomonas theicola]PPT92129.1 hybrid sensor histidine kinase/response regulator [Xanthomonas theicola]QNH24205.1 response regulator [Xanthomonas theicola]
MKGRLEWVRNRLRQRTDTEHGQTLIRVVIFLGVIACMTIAETLGRLAPDVYMTSVLMSGVGVLVGAALFAAILVAPGKSNLRRIVGMATDYGLMTAAMILLGEPLAWLYVILMWVTIGNGLRYGNRYLIGAVVSACVSFGCVVLLNGYWRENVTLGVGLWAGLVAIPMYLSGLLRQLTQATAEARRASEAKSRFLANMSHEFRTPLNGLSGMTEVLATTKLDAEQRECVGTIQASARSLLSLVEEVLDISAIEAGKVRTEKHDFSLRETLAQIGLILQPQARAKALGYHLEVADDVPDQVRGDAGHLRQILLNLAGNAIKFTNLGRVDIRVRIQRDAAGEPHRLSFDIVDTGIGLPPAMRPRLFEAFEQVDGGLSRRYEGTGLGTTIAKGLVEAMGGSIGYQESPPRGSRFWFELPFEAAAASSLPTQPADAAAEEAVAPGGNIIAFTDPFLRHRARVRSMRVLVADDHAANRMVLQRLLQKAGHRVVCLDGAEAVLDALAETDFDAVIVDLHMPGMSGLDMLKQLRLMQAGRPRIPVVVLSADVTPESIQRCEQAGAHTFLAKPVVASRLLDTLADIATDGRLRPSEAQTPPRFAAEGVLDASVLDELAGLGMGDGFEREFISQCLNDAKGCLGGVQMAGEAENWERLREHAHAVKGVASNLGLVKTASLGGELMRMADWQMRSEWRQCLAALNASLTEGRQVLDLRALQSGQQDGNESR